MTRRRSTSATQSPNRPAPVGDTRPDASMLPDLSQRASEAIAAPPAPMAEPDAPFTVHTAPDGRVVVGLDDAQRARLLRATGAPDLATATHFVGQLVDLERPRTDEPEAERVARRAALAQSMLEGIGPTGVVEGMMAVQLAALHDLTMSTMRRAARASHEDTRERLLRQAARLSSAFAGHVDTLKRWRATGTQRVIVERVDVHAGGQAVVGAVEAGGRGNR